MMMRPDFWNARHHGIEQSPRGNPIVNSPRAGGRYEITSSAEAMAADLTDSEKVNLTSWLNTQRRAGVETPLITSETIRLSKQHQFVSVSERRDNLLITIGNRAEKIGKEIQYRERYYAVDTSRKPDPNWPTRDYLLSVTASVDISELDTLIDFAKEQGYIKSDKYTLSLTFDGLTRIEELKTHPTNSAQAFVAMWFHEEVSAAYAEGFSPAIIDAGYKPLRIDQKEHNNKIDDEIIAEIRRSSFVVADFTCSMLPSSEGNNIAIPRGGVYYEAGFAQGLGIPVIWCCRSDQINHVHFDTRQFNHITWESSSDLRAKLRNRIGAVLGDGPLKATE